MTNGRNGEAAGAPYALPLRPVELTIAGSAGVGGGVANRCTHPGGFVPGGPATAQLAVETALLPPLTIWLE
jgi:hypothetical protein